MTEPAGGGSGGAVSHDPTRAAVAGVIQKLAAARLGRGLLPLAAIFVFGGVQMLVRGPFEADYAALALGSLAAGAGMLLYGNGAVRRALGKEGVAWSTAAGAVPYGFAFYVLGFRGLRPLAHAAEAGAGGVLLALLFLLVSGRLLWHVSRLSELHRLARSMIEPGPGEGA